MNRIADATWARRGSCTEGWLERLRFAVFMVLFSLYIWVYICLKHGHLIATPRLQTEHSTARTTVDRTPLLDKGHPRGRLILRFKILFLKPSIHHFWRHLTHDPWSMTPNFFRLSYRGRVFWNVLVSQSPDSITSCQTWAAQPVWAQFLRGSHDRSFPFLSQGCQPHVKRQL